MAPDADNPTLLQVLVLERGDRAKNMARFYVLSIEPTLFEDLALVRCWGRIGSAGRERIDLHPSRRVAQIELAKWLDRKRRRGYQLRAYGRRQYGPVARPIGLRLGFCDRTSPLPFVSAFAAWAFGFRPLDLGYEFLRHERDSHPPTRMNPEHPAEFGE